MLFRVEDSTSKETTLVADAAQVALLTDVRALRYLAPFLCGEQTLSSASAAAGVPPSTMAYWLPKFQQAGLIEVAGSRKRAGMASPRYRATADAFLIEAGQADRGRVEALLTSARTAMNEHIGAAIDTMDITRMLRLAIRGNTPTMVDVHAEPCVPATPAVVRLSLDPLRLSHARARALWDDLRAVVERYKAGSGKGTEYVIQLGIAPAEPRRRE